VIGWLNISPEGVRYFRRAVAAMGVVALGVATGFVASWLSWRWLQLGAFGFTMIAIIWSGWLTISEVWRRINVVADFLTGEERAK